MLCHAEHMDATAVQTQMAENVRVLLAMTGIRTQASLARRLEWEPAKVTRLLKGSQEWTLTDILAVGQAFGLRDPFLLVRPVSELVGAARPTGTASGAGQLADHDDNQRVTLG